MLAAGILCLLALILAVIIFHKIPVSRAQNSSSTKIYLGEVFKNRLSYKGIIVNFNAVIPAPYLRHQASPKRFAQASRRMLLCEVSLRYEARVTP